MQVRILPAFVLFIGSYFPLSAVLLLQDVAESSWQLPLCRWSTLATCSLPQLANPGRAIGIVVFCAISLAIFLVILRSLKGRHEVEIVQSKTIPNDLINYVFPYVVSFMGLDLGSNGKFYGFLLFVLWMFIITYRSGQILMNPLLLVAGWQLYEVSAIIEGHNRCLRAISKTRILPGDKLKSCVVQGIYVLSSEGAQNHDSGSEPATV